LLLGSIAGISLVVGGIGIMNMMLTSVTERIREIGLRMAVGATRWDLTSQFLTEAVALTMLGGVIGITLGWGIAAGISSFSSLKPVVSMLSVVVAVGGVGDRAGRVGYGFGKANEVSDAIRKGGEAARKHMVKIIMHGKTIPHEVQGACDGGRVLLKPAPDGSGIIAGGGMRPVLEAAGVRDVIGKSLGSKNRLNVVKATIASLQKLRSAESIAAARA